MESRRIAKAPQGASAKNKNSATAITKELPKDEKTDKIATTTSTTTTTTSTTLTTANAGHSTSAEKKIAANANKSSAVEAKNACSAIVQKTTTTMQPPIEAPKKRKMRIRSAPNIAKRRTVTQVELPTDGNGMVLVDKNRKAATTSSAYTTEDDEDCTYMSEGGEGLFKTGDNNVFAGLSSPDASDEEIESAIEAKIEEVRGEMSQLQQKLNPLIQALKAKQEARREKEEQERIRKISQAPVKEAPKTKQQQHQQPTKETTADQQKKQQQQQQQQQKQQNQQQQKPQQQIPQQQRQRQLKQQQQTQQQQPQMQTVKKDRVPPIKAYKLELQDTINLCKSAIGQNFIIKRLGQNKHSIQCNNLENYKIVKDILKQSSTEFFSFTPKVEKLQTVLLKGIDSFTEPQVLLEEPCQKAGDDLEFIGVKPFSTVKTRREKRKLPIFLVQLSPSSKLEKLRSISVLNYQVVSWDTLKRRGDMLQCMRCQRFGHAATNCEMQSRCVKCSENHKINECRLGNERVEDKTLLKCVICHGDGHPANYRGCPAFQQMKQQQQKKAKQPVVEVRPPTRAPTSMPVNPQISYAQMAAGRGSTVQPAPKAAQPALVPRAPDAQAEIRSMLLAIQGQLTGLQNQIREQASRVDYLYSRLPSLTLVG